MKVGPNPFAAIAFGCKPKAWQVYQKPNVAPPVEQTAFDGIRPMEQLITDVFERNDKTSASQRRF